MWDWAEQIAARRGRRRRPRHRRNIGWEELPGEGAFYAPKLEFHLTDAIGRTWQVGTIQTDTVLPERLDASYIGEDGEKHRPVMLHRAILGTFERFIGILIEHHAGKLPAVAGAGAGGGRDDRLRRRRLCARGRRRSCAPPGLRVEADLRNEKINYKVREHSLAKVPLLLVVGKREAEEGTVALRRLGSRRAPEGDEPRRGRRAVRRRGGSAGSAALSALTRRSATGCGKNARVAAPAPFHSGVRSA